MKSIFISLFFLSAQALAQPITLGFSYQSKLDKEIDGEFYGDIQSVFSPYMSYALNEKWSVVGELGWSQSKSSTSLLNIEEKTYEGLLWGRYNVIVRDKWSFFGGLGSGSYIKKTSTKWRGSSRSDSSKAYLQLGSLMGVDYKVIKQLKVDAQIRAYYPFPNEEIEMRGVLSLSYLL